MADCKGFKKDDKVRHRFRTDKYQKCVVIKVEQGCNCLITVMCEDGFYGKKGESTFPPQDLVHIP